MDHWQNLCFITGIVSSFFTLISFIGFLFLFSKLKKIFCRFFSLFYPVAFRPEDCSFAFIIKLMLECLLRSSYCLRISSMLSMFWLLQIILSSSSNGCLISTSCLRIDRAFPLGNGMAVLLIPTLISSQNNCRSFT